MVALCGQLKIVMFSLTDTHAGVVIDPSVSWGLCGPASYPSACRNLVCCLPPHCLGTCDGGLVQGMASRCLRLETTYAGLENSQQSVSTGAIGLLPGSLPYCGFCVWYRFFDL